MDVYKHQEEEVKWCHICTLTFVAHDHHINANESTVCYYMTFRLRMFKSSWYRHIQILSFFQITVI